MQAPLILLLVAFGLGACQSMGPAFTTAATSEELFVATDEPARVGREQFARGNYGLAEKYFRSAVERVPQDGDAWVGLAASYDQLGRFDLADRAYTRATQVKGTTAQILNNRGFSYLLRGDGTSAGRMFARARSLDPANVVVANNLAILRSAPR